MGEFIIPRFFAGQDHFPLLSVDGLSAVEYRTSANQSRNRIIATSHLFVMVLNGTKTVQTGREELRIEAGGAFFARKGSYLFSETLSDDNQYRTLVFFIDDAFLERFVDRHLAVLDRAGDGPTPNVFALPVSPLLQACARALLPFFEHGTDLSRELMRLKLEETLLHVIAADVEGRFVRFLRAQHLNRRRSLEAVMEEYFRAPLPLAELAKLSGRSPSAFKRDFKKVYDEAPGRWISNRRLEHARMLLSNGGLSVSQACLEAGFDNFSHFSQAFKKRFGVSPSAVRKSPPATAFPGAASRPTGDGGGARPTRAA